MRLLTRLPAHLRVLSRSQVVLRAVVLLAPVVAAVAAGLAGDAPPWWYAGLLAVLAAGWAVAPEAHLGVAVNLAVLVWWAIGPDDGLHPAVLVAAAALVVAHVAALLTAYGPSAMPVDPALVRRWLVRGGAALLAAPVVWALARLLRDAPAQPRLWVLGVGAALLTTVVASLSLGGDQPEETP